jgi:uncharacterized protein YciI
MPLWVRTMLSSGPLDEVERAAQGHRRQIEELRAAGRLRAAGELDDGDGFVDIFEAADLLEADAIARADPLVEGGLVAWTVRRWTEL